MHTRWMLAVMCAFTCIVPLRCQQRESSRAWEEACEWARSQGAESWVAVDPSEITSKDWVKQLRAAIEPDLGYSIPVSIFLTFQPKTRRQRLIFRTEGPLSPLAQAALIHLRKPDLPWSMIEPQLKVARFVLEADGTSTRFDAYLEPIKAFKAPVFRTDGGWYLHPTEYVLESFGGREEQIRSRFASAGWRGDFRSFDPSTYSDPMAHGLDKILLMLSQRLYREWRAEQEQDGFRRLLQGIDLEADGSEWLYAACSDKWTALVDALLIRGVSWKPRVASGMSFLNALVMLGREDLILKAIRSGLDVNDGGIIDGFPITLAAAEGQTGLVRMLSEHGAAVNPHVQFGNWPLHAAARNNHLQTVELLLDLGANPYPDKDSGSVLGAAGEGGSLDVAKVLIKRGVRPVPGDLLLTVRGGSLELVNLILSHATSVNWNGQDSEALSTAVTGNRADIVKALLDAGAPVEFPDTRSSPRGLSPMESARRLGLKDIEALLIKAGAKP